MSASIVVPLDFWQDPQSDAILVYSEHECLIYFAFWIAAGEAADFIGQLSFERSCGVRSYGREYLPYELPNHYVVEGHDIYHEILASGLTTSTISHRDITDPRLLRL
jgi:hypothetical protein